MGTISRTLQDAIVPVANFRGTVRRMLVLLLPVLLLGSIPAFPEDRFWEKKDYRQWSQQECDRLLYSSPWAKAYKTLHYRYHVRLRTALPIQQAIARQRQIAENYDNLSPEKRQEFDKRAEGLLSVGSPETIVVNVTGFSTGYYWQHQTTDTLKHSVFLIHPRSGKIPLLKFELLRSDPLSAEFQFIFPRQYKGSPILSMQDKFLRLEFSHPGEIRFESSALGSSGGIAQIEFKVNEMLIKGELMY